jgi:hypothetical protein
MKRAMSRAERKRSIRDAFIVANSKGDDAPHSIAWIAKRIGLVASQKLRIIVNEMVGEGVLVSFWVDATSNRWGGKMYALDVIKTPVRRRHIAINRAGKVVDQLELWS